MRYQKIYTQIWQDEKFTKLDIDSQILFLYLLTSPHSNAIGFYSLPIGYIHADLYWSINKVKKKLTQLIQKNFILYDEKNSIILIKNYFKFNPIDNQNLFICAIKILNSLPKNSLISYIKPFIEPLFNKYQSPYPSPFKAPTLAPPNSEAVPETETETETETKTKEYIYPPVYKKNPLNLQNKKKYGEFQNVSLTNIEYSKLIDKFSEPITKEFIEQLSQYIASKNKKYYSHYATLLTWMKKSNASNINDYIQKKVDNFNTHLKKIPNKNSQTIKKSDV